MSFLQSFEFLWAWALIFLPLPWIVRRFVVPAAQNQTPLLAPHLVRRLSGQVGQNVVQNNSFIRGMPPLLLLIWILLVVAAMRPVWFLTPTSFNATGRDMMLAVDLSGSMEKTDMRLGAQEVDRLTSVKAVVSEFIEKRQGDRMGLVVFGSQAFLQSPLSYDLKTVNTLLQETEIGMAGNNTAIGDAIGLTLKHLKKTRQQNTVLILLTDGSNTDGAVQPLDAAKQAKQMGLKIYTIGIGQADTGSIDRFLFGGGRDMDVVTLKKIAKITGGQFFLAADTEQLNEVYQIINTLEASEHQIHQYRLREELYVWPLGAAFIISLLLAYIRLYQPLWQRMGDR